MTKPKNRKRKPKTQPRNMVYSWMDRPQSVPSNGKALFLDYYYRPLLLLQQEYMKDPSCSRSPHPVRERFWQFVPPGTYELYKARDLLKTYLSSLESEVRNCIQQSSMAYWLHLCRRIFPGPIGKDTQPGTVGLTRAVMEAAIQKYAGTVPCKRIGLSKEVPLESIFGGLLMAQDLDIERKIIKKGGNQLVLTDFSERELAEFYALEKLAYEVWRVGATLRSIGKGIGFVVEDTEERFRDDRSNEMNRLLKTYDNRLGGDSFSASAMGAVFGDLGMRTSKRGFIFLPTYNVAEISTDLYRDGFSRVFGISFPEGFKTNFVWIPFNLRDFRNVHLPLAYAFNSRYGVSLDAVLAVIAALADKVFYMWSQTKGIAVLRYWQRAYEGPDKRTQIKAIIRKFLPRAAHILDLPERSVLGLDIEAAVDYWSLFSSTRTDIDLAYSGPHSMFWPYDDTYIFTDYAWIMRRLYDLFFEVSVEDQNFKGEALERVLQSPPSVLPRKVCEDLNGQKRQIDYARAVGKHLVIAECKAVGKSIAFDRGDPEAIKYRRERVVEATLRQADEKGHWLTLNPKGKNYDVIGYDDILPIGVSPFVEFIPSLDFRYWISEEIPRVVTPEEFLGIVKNPAQVETAMNRIPIRK